MTNIVELLDAAGLTGRGGAAFSTATKVAAALEHRADLIVNVCDGELGARKDAWVVEHHLDELIAGAALVSRRITYAAHRGSATVARLNAAQQAVLEVPRRYVSSQESSLISLAHGGPARPMTRRQPFVGGGRDAQGRVIRPTVVLNAETVWRIWQISQYGPQWFRSHGTWDEPGPRLATVIGHVARPQVIETEAGVLVPDLLAQAGAFDADALLIGGLGGAFVPMRSAASLTWQSESLRPLGPGLLDVVDPATCPVDVVTRMLRYAAGESAGQCGPCMFGLPALLAQWEQLVAEPDPAQAQKLDDHLALLAGRGACRHPDGVAGLCRSALGTFSAHIFNQRHIGSASGACTHRTELHHVPA